MKRKKAGLVLGMSLGLVGLAAFYRLKEADQEKQDQAMKAQLREFFTNLGTIEVMYFNDYDQADEATSGGVVMTDGRHYQFSYYQGDFAYEEVSQ
ncbi:DUF4651 domain-containing protein [Streptococcus cuniculipharyngis]|uniref:DUF4651 domain-containing protein n=1 Tax=Streptococcus cuniculipharyngis TaxID=1562651 RepID=A0A5C5S984_9STRE|nr:DUF4651 domain-containing protein [Streptococcus cuniculipharyngis]TWS96448.1 DUF4651 domain-containing protein [Streptococcus cuniculipharyngis]